MRLRGGSGRLVASIAGVAGLALGLFGLSGVVGSPAQAYAPVDQPGPALSVPTAVLNAAISCDQNPSTVHRDIILLVPPTLFDPAEAYGWNYEPAFRALGYPYCTVTFPDYSDGDVQVNGEYVVNAVRVLYGKSGRQVELFGWSQGASTAPRWALRWWPDIRPMVASLVGLAPVNEYGSDTVEGYCVVECIPAAWQQVRRITGASPNFMNALDSIQQTFPGIAYTVIYSLTDEVAGFNVITPAVWSLRWGVLGMRARLAVSLQQSIAAAQAAAKRDTLVSRFVAAWRGKQTWRQRAVLHRLQAQRAYEDLEALIPPVQGLDKLLADVTSF